MFGARSIFADVSKDASTEVGSDNKRAWKKQKKKDAKGKKRLKTMEAFQEPDDWRSHLNIISLPARTGVETGRISVLK